MNLEIFHEKTDPHLQLTQKQEILVLHLKSKIKLLELKFQNSPEPLRISNNLNLRYLNDILDNVNRFNFLLHDLCEDPKSTINVYL